MQKRSWNRSEMPRRIAKTYRDDGGSVSVARVLLLGLAVFALVSLIDIWHVVEMRHFLFQVATDAVNNAALERPATDAANQTEPTNLNSNSVKYATESTIDYLMKTRGILTYNTDVRVLPDVNNTDNLNLAVSSDVRQSLSRNGIEDSVTVEAYVEAPAQTFLLGWLEGKPSVTVYALAAANMEKAQTPTATPTTVPTATLATATPSPTTTPRLLFEDGLVLDTARVRASPDLSAPVVGLLEGGRSVQIIGRDESGHWLRVLTPVSGWIYEPLILRANASEGQLPIIATAPWVNWMATPISKGVVPTLVSTPIRTSTPTKP